MEVRFVVSCISFFSRLDYCSGSALDGIVLSSMLLVKNLGCVDVVMKLLSHTLNVACSVADLGLVSLILWVFEDRELCLDLLELISGVRLHSSCIVPGLMYRDVSTVIQVELLVLQSYQCVINSLLLGLTSLQSRLKYVCCVAFFFFFSFCVFGLSFAA